MFPVMQVDQGERESSGLPKLLLCCPLPLILQASADWKSGDKNT